MTYSPITDQDVKSMLKAIGISSIDDLFTIIPDKYKVNLEDSSLPDALSEQEINDELLRIGNLNSAANSICFMGGGSYDHYVPKVVDFLSSRSEFYTAYTPYQPEVSQGTLQYLYEFQTMICELSGMEISNASLYDGASAIAEACSMAINVNNKKRVLLSSTLNPKYINVVKTYFSTNGIDIELIDSKDGITSIDSMKDQIDDNTACIVVQSPNYFGLIEDWTNIVKNKKIDNVLVIAVSDPSCLPILKSPFDCGCDVYVGEGQSLGNYMSFGGPYIGLFATLLKYARKMPGRIIGRTVDIDEKEGFVMTLQTREQHIRRERATSNICTNQGLIALRSTIYMALMGKHGMPAISKRCYDNSQYAASKIEQLKNYSLYFNSRSFIKEFIVKSNFKADRLITAAYKNGIRIGKVSKDKTNSLLLMAFTEKRNKSEIDKLISFLDNYKE